MSRRFRPTDAFVDESIRGRRYIMGCVLVEARHLAQLRSTAKGLADGVAPRIHFNNDTNRQRRRVLDAIGEMPIQVFAVICVKGHGVTEFQARAMCVTEIVERLQGRRVAKLVIESRQNDLDDARTITVARSPEPRLVFEHRTARHEQILWIADAVTWAAGSGPRWSERLGSTLEGVYEVRP
ncbi:MAG: hypothetical protein CL424_12135 [Acidimicrobiaceae bacterium]|nr:hypothetical protein [Acidimicrobiaceae bacterium]